MKKKILLASVGALMLTLACVTVNVYFPAAEVQQAADKIVEEVQGQPAATEEKTMNQQSMLMRTMHALLPIGGQAYAQADIDVTTPNIRAIKNQMKERFDSLRPLYDQGVIGETNDGMLSLRSTEGLELKDKATAKKLVDAENSDRGKLYREIVAANDLPSDSLGQVQDLFANSWRKSARNGWWIQTDDGEWVKKGAN